MQIISSAPERLNNFLNSVTDAVTESALLPAAKSSYWLAGKVTAGSLGLLSNSLGKAVTKSWYDPFSTELVLQLCKPIELLSRAMAARTPMKNRVCTYMDTSLISFFQQVYAYLKEVNHLLSLPQDLKKYLATLSFERLLSKPKLIFGRAWVWLIFPVIFIKHMLFKLINLVMEIIDLALCCFTFNYTFKLFGYLKEITREVSTKAHGGFVEIAQRVVEGRERRIRSQIVVSVGSCVIDYLAVTTNRICLKALLGIGAYSYIRPALQASLQFSGTSIDVAGFAVIGYLYWENVLVPTLDPYYQNFIEEFDVNHSNLMGFLKAHSVQYLYPPLRALQLYLKR